MILSVSLVGTTTFAVIQTQYNSYLRDQIHSLEGQVNTLSDNVSNLEGNYSEILTKYGNLSSNYTDLKSEYDALLTTYSNLFSDFTTLQNAFDNPLANPVIPTSSEVQNWLAQDDTDRYQYVTGVWMCGDFAAMLMTHAKEMNWRFRIAVMDYSVQGDSDYGSTVGGSGQYGHAFNLIQCTDGVWYIEPQTDAMWYITSGGVRSTFDIHTYYNFIDSTIGTVWDGYEFWSNYYNYFG